MIETMASSRGAMGVEVARGVEGVELQKAMGAYLRVVEEVL